MSNINPAMGVNISPATMQMTKSIGFIPTPYTHVANTQGRPVNI